MKICYSSDAHASDMIPSSRSDDYFEAFKKKFKYMINYCLDNNIQRIIHAGDLFDKHNAKYKVTNFIMEELNLWRSMTGSFTFLMIAGQHDMQYHSSWQGTPYESLISAGLAFHLNKEPYEMFTHANDEETGDLILQPVHIYGCSYGEETPEIQNDKVYNILVVHKMIVHEKLWEGQENYTPALGFLRSNKFNLIIAGDNHQPFTIYHRSKNLTMCGSIMRKSIDQKDYQPHFYITDLVTNEHMRVPFPIEKDVFKEEVIENKKQKVLIDKFAESLKNSTVSTLKFADRVNRAIEKNELEPHVITAITEVMEAVNG